MNDSLKTVLMLAGLAILASLGFAYLGLEQGNLFDTFSASFFSILETAAILAFCFFGSTAAIEVARYFRRKNQELEHAARPAQAVLTESELQLGLRRAVAEEITPVRNELQEVRSRLPVEVPTEKVA